MITTGAAWFLSAFFICEIVAKVENRDFIKRTRSLEYFERWRNPCDITFRHMPTCNDFVTYYNNLPAHEIPGTIVETPIAFE